MKSLFILIVLLMAVFISSFTATENPKEVTVAGHLIDYKTGGAIGNSDLIYFTDATVIKSKFHSSGVSKTDSKGNFSFKLYLNESDRSFDIGFAKYAGVHFVYVSDGQSVNLGDVYAVAYNNELSTTKIDSTIQCFDFVEKMEGDSISLILRNLKTNSNGFFANPIDTVMIGNSAEGAEGPNCWFNYKTLSLTKDLKGK